jgi:hypothetical protein
MYIRTTTKKCSSLPEHEQQRRWMTEFRMPEDAFLQLLQQVQPYLYSSSPKNTKAHVYRKREAVSGSQFFGARSNVEAVANQVYWAGMHATCG